MKKTNIALFSQAILLLLLVCIHTVKCQTVIQTHSGPVLGVQGDGFDYWKGIPFAQAPVGDLRWQQPVEAQPWTTPLKATEFGPQCPQKCVLPTGLCAATMSEDCLTLNVYRPNNGSSPSKLPVMVFLPGGHFDMGTANCELYDGSYFVKRGQVILVTVNYRLGVLGFMVDSQRGLVGNYGVQDQRLALRWIQKNIESFGGDPNSITLFGESAGAACVTAHLISPLSVGLFNRVIIQSVPLSLPFLNSKLASDLGQRFAKEANCDSDRTSNCIKKLTWQDIVPLQDKASDHFYIAHPLVTFMPYTPTIDGNELKVGPIDAFKTGNFQQLDMIMGSCSEEARMFIYLALSKKLTTVEYDAALLGLFFKNYLSVMGMYSPKHDDKREDLSILGTDYIFTAPTRYALSNVYNKTQNTNLFLYQFDHSLSFDGWGPRYPFCVNHSCHGADMPFTFHNFSPFNPNSEEDALSNTMIDFWTNFAYSGNPNKGPHTVTTNWQSFTPENLMYMHLTTPNVANEYGLRKKQCDLWDRLGYNFGT